MNSITWLLCINSISGPASAPACVFPALRCAALHCTALHCAPSPQNPQARNRNEPASPRRFVSTGASTSTSSQHQWWQQQHASPLAFSPSLPPIGHRTAAAL